MIVRNESGKNPAMPSLDAVPERWRARVGDLFDTWTDVMGRNRVLRDYYEMHNRLRDLGISVPPTLTGINCVTGWCSKAIHAHSSRSVFDGYVFDGQADGTLDSLVRANRMRSAYRMACASALTYGVSAMTVMRGGAGMPAAVVRTYSANQFCALWDKDAGRIACGVVLADVDRGGNATRYVCHFPDAVLTLTRSDADATPARWSCEVEPNPMGRPLMEVFCNDPDPDRPLGHSMLTPELLGIVDKAMRDVLRMEIGAEFFTFPQRYILGCDDGIFSAPPEDEPGATDGREPDVDVTDPATEWDPADESTNPARKSTPLERFNAYIGSFIAINRDENGDLPQVGQFPAPTADNFTRVFENDAQRFSGATNVPLAQLGVLSNTYTSSDALGAANDPLILEVERINADNKETLEEVARMMMAVAGGVPLDGLTEQQRGVQAYFQDPSMPTIAARADAWTKLAGADNGIVGTDVYYEGVGLSRPTIQRLRAETRQHGAIASLARMADAMEAAGAGDAGNGGAQ